MPLKFDPNIDLDNSKNKVRKRKASNNVKSRSANLHDSTRTSQPKSAVGGVVRKSTNSNVHKRNTLSQNASVASAHTQHEQEKNSQSDFYPTDPKIAKKRAKQENKMRKKAEKQQASIQKEEYVLLKNKLKSKKGLQKLKRALIKILVRLKQLKPYIRQANLLTSINMFRMDTKRKSQLFKPMTF